MRAKEWGDMREEIAGRVRVVLCRYFVTKRSHCVSAPKPMDDLRMPTKSAYISSTCIVLQPAYVRWSRYFLREFAITKVPMMHISRSTTCWRVLTRYQRNIDRNSTMWYVVILLGLFFSCTCRTESINTFYCTCAPKGETSNAGQGHVWNTLSQWFQIVIGRCN